LLTVNELIVLPGGQVPPSRRHGMPLAASNVAALHDVAPVHLAGRCQ